ncbi:MAG: MFS transporter [Chloroflexi bacterium]|nr:MFS transporter [Chloroflexota bacterium]
MFRFASKWSFTGLFVVLLPLLIPAAIVWADEGHGEGEAMALSGPLLWGMGLLGLFLMLALGVVGVWFGWRGLLGPGEGTTGIAGYFRTMRRFSLNGKLYLTYSLLSGLGTGIWNVMFNLYLLRAGFDLGFIGMFWLVDMLFHGIFAFPAGLIGDKIGRRKAFILATTINILARGALLFVVSPTPILVLAAIAGMGEGFHAVAGPPFIMENSEPEERPHLFSLDASFLQISTFVGSLSGGLLPVLWAGSLGLPPLEPSAARWALVTSLPLTFVALIPLALIKEKPVALVESFRDLFTLRNIVSHQTIFKLALCGIFLGLGFGLTTRFFNVFFYEVHHLSDEMIGAALAIGSLGAAFSILVSPIMTRKWGNVRSIFLSMTGSIPFLFLMAVIPGVPLVTFFFVMRGALYSISMPLRNQLSMEFIISKERATTAGLVHMAFDLGGAVGAGMLGLLVIEGNFVPAFTTASFLLLIPAALYYVFFRGMEERRKAEKLAVRPSS